MIKNWLAEGKSVCSMTLVLLMKIIHAAVLSPKQLSTRLCVKLKF